MTLTALPPLDPTSPTFRTDVDTFFSSRIQNFVSEANQMAANLNSIAAGGAYAIPYVWGLGNIAGRLATSPAASENVALGFDINNVAASGLNMLPALQQFDQGNSAVRGQLRIVKLTDPAEFLLFNITQRTDNGVYQHFDGAMIHASATNPFVAGDSVMLYFQRTGDKGDTGSAYTPQGVKFSDRKPSGTAGGSAVAGDATQVRTLNTTDYNTIPSGVSLSGNQFTLPAGTYDFWGRAPAWGVGNHKASLYNVTDGQIALAGSSTYASGGQASYADQTESFFSGRITLSAPKTFVVRHYTQNIGGTNALGCATSVSGQLETYTEVNVTKIA